MFNLMCEQLKFSLKIDFPNIDIPPALISHNSALIFLIFQIPFLDLMENE